jgi:hypothetical protein
MNCYYAKRNRYISRNYDQNTLSLYDEYDQILTKGLNKYQVQKKSTQPTLQLFFTE